MKKLIALSFTLLLVLSLRAQIAEGDALIHIVGSRTGDAATQNFRNAYDIKNTAGAKYSASKTGIDMMASHDTLVSMTLYRENVIYGSYANKLPKGLKFDMSSAEIVKLLGKPTTEYMNSGYCEYHFDNYVMTCWFEKGVLRRVTISLK